MTPSGPAAAKILGLCIGGVIIFVYQGDPPARQQGAAAAAATTWRLPCLLHSPPTTTDQCQLFAKKHEASFNTSYLIGLF